MQQSLLTDYSQVLRDNRETFSLCQRFANRADSCETGESGSLASTNARD
jgi:hypothetical protein